MINYYKSPNGEIKWKIIDETKTVFQVKNGIDSKYISRTTNESRYNDVKAGIVIFPSSTEEEFNTAFNEVIAVLNG